MPHLSYSERKALRHVPAVISSHPQFNLKEKKKFPSQEPHSYLSKPTATAPREREGCFFVPRPTTVGRLKLAITLRPIFIRFATVEVTLSKEAFSLKATSCRKGDKAKSALEEVRKR